MAKTYEKIKEEGEYEFGKNLLKTYILESNYKEPKEFFNSLNSKANVNCTEIEQDAFVVDYKKSELEVNFFIDTLNPRFWLLHTISPAKDTDVTIGKFVQPIISHLDYLWMDKLMLQDIKKEHGDYTKSIGIQYRYGDVFPSSDFGDSFSLRANGVPSDILMKIFSQHPELAGIFAISSVGFKKLFDSNDNGHDPSLLIEDVYYQGKFTVKGTSIYDHIDTVSDILGKYENLLKIIESEYNMEYLKAEDGFTITGSPLCIDFKKSIENLDVFVKTVFSAKEPFRLSGFHSKVDLGTYLISCLDLHNGDDLRLELTEDWVRIYLPSNACGNTTMRFLCNLQRYYDADASLEGINSGRIR